MYKVLWITNIPSPYRVEFFNQLGMEVDLTVLFERNNSSERDDKWFNKEFRNFRAIFLKGMKFKADSLISVNVTHYINKQFDFIFLSNPMTPTGITASFYMKLFNIPFIIEGDGAFKPIKESKFRFYIKKWALNKAKFYFSTGDDHSSYYSHYGISSSKIIRYSFSSMNSSEILKKSISNNEKNKKKKTISLKPIFTIIFIGRFVYGKGIDTLLKAVSQLNFDFQLILIGGKKEEISKFGKSDHYKTHIVEFTNKKEILNYLDLSDIFVFPTRKDVWGLVINEAFARGIPVISTNASGAANNLIADSINGFVIDVEDYSSLAKKINILESDSELRYQMSEKAIEVAKKYTIEKMVKEHIDFMKKNYV